MVVCRRHGIYLGKGLIELVQDVLELTKPTNELKRTERADATTFRNVDYSKGNADVMFDLVEGYSSPSLPFVTTKCWQMWCKWTNSELKLLGHLLLH